MKHVLTLTLALALALILGPAAAQPAAAQGASLVLYSGRSESLVGPIIEQFEAATGIDVQVRFAGTPQLAATLLEEGPNTPADVFYAQDPGGLGAVESLLGQVPERLLARVPEEFRSPEGLWAGISGRARVLVYNTNNVSESDLPDDIFDLTRPEWRGRLGWAPSNGSFQTMVTGMRQLWGEERTRAWLAGIQANDPLVFPNNSSQVAAAAQGEIDVGMVNHYYLFRFLAEEGEDFPARNYHPRGGGPGALIMVSGAGILGGAANRESAERFVEFMLSTVAQQFFASQTFEYPVVEGVRTERLLIPLEEIESPEIALGDLADLEGTQALLREIGVLP